MIWLLSTALAGTAVLHVGVHREAGTASDVAADGAAGQCVVQHSRVTCPANGPVRFRWGPGGEWALVGDVVVEPGEVGIAHVLAPEGSTMDRLIQLEGADFNLVESLVVENGDNPLPPADRAFLDALEGLAVHEDWRIRIRAIWGLTPYWRHTRMDPFHTNAPRLIREGLIEGLRMDKDFRVRRALAVSMRDVPMDSPYASEAREAVIMLLGDPTPQVRRAAVKPAATGATGASSAREAWLHALRQAREPGPAGRAACVALALLNRQLSGADVDARFAVATVLQHHPEKAWRVWAAWREDVPYEDAWAEFLLKDTVGLSAKLIRAWGRDSPEELAATLHRWEPMAPHSRRYRLIRQALAEETDPAIRAVLDR